MMTTHAIVRDAHRNRLARRAAMDVPGAEFDAIEVSEAAAKIVARADRKDIIDTRDLDAFQQSMVSAMLGLLAESPFMQVSASKTAYEILKDVTYEPRLSKQMMVGSQALAVEAIITRVRLAADEVIRHLAMLRHEDRPALIDDSQQAESDALRKHFDAQRALGLRATASKPWLFGKGDGIPPAERKRIADEERLARRAAKAAAHAEAEADGRAASSPVDAGPSDAARAPMGDAAE